MFMSPNSLQYNLSCFLSDDYQDLLYYIDHFWTLQGLCFFHVGPTFEQETGLEPATLRVEILYSTNWATLAWIHIFFYFILEADWENWTLIFWLQIRCTSHCTKSALGHFIVQLPMKLVKAKKQGVKDLNPLLMIWSHRCYHLHQHPTLTFVFIYSILKKLCR